MSNVPFWGPDFAMLEAEDPEIAGILLSELDRTAYFTALRERYTVKIDKAALEAKE